jgi:hypothetical protein
MQDSIITWNFANWITVAIMAAVGFAVLATIAQIFHSAVGTKSAS